MFDNYKTSVENLKIKSYGGEVCAQFSIYASKLNGSIAVANENFAVDGKSVLALLSLGLFKDDVVHILIEKEEDKKEIEEIFEKTFGKE